MLEQYKRMTFYEYKHILLEQTSRVSYYVPAEGSTTCRRGTGIGSKGSIGFCQILTITTIWGICSSLDSQPKTLQQIGFGHSSVTVRFRNGATLQRVRIHRTRDQMPLGMSRCDGSELLRDGSIGKSCKGGDEI
jgi:hypothetical protein